MPFLDHAATSPMDARLLPLLQELLALPANPSSVHRPGQKARARLEDARRRMADVLGLSHEEVVFTASATEANNTVLRGLAMGAWRQGWKLGVLSSPLEHSCIRQTIESLAAQSLINAAGLDVDPSGQALLPIKPVFPLQLLCLMAVQNETGVVQPLVQAGDFARENGMRWLCDATQALGAMDLRHGALGYDFLTASSHKVYGPPGVGLLAGPGVRHLLPLITGGPQENEHRAGTQPVAMICAFVQAVEWAVEERLARRSHLSGITETILSRLRGKGIPFELNGAAALVQPGFLNLSIAGYSGADLVLALDARGFAVSSGAACATGVIEPSVALTAMYHGDPARVAGALRVTPGSGTTIDEAIQFADALAAIVLRG